LPGDNFIGDNGDESSSGSGEGKIWVGLGFLRWAGVFHTDFEFAYTSGFANVFLDSVLMVLDVFSVYFLPAVLVFF
jgi:hypothetical protein